MKILFYFCILLIISSSANAQNICQSIDDIMTHSTRSSFDNASLQSIKGGTYKKDSVTYTIYAYPADSIHLHYFGGVEFKSALMTFDSHDQLTMMDFMRLYGIKNSPGAKQADKDYKELVKHFAQVMGREGEKKTYYNSNKYFHGAYEWTCNNSIIKLQYQYSKNIKPRRPTIDLVIEKK